MIRALARPVSLCSTCFPQSIIKAYHTTLTCYCALFNSPFQSIIKAYRMASQLAVDKVRDMSISLEGKGDDEKKDLLKKCAMTTLNSKLVRGGAREGSTGRGKGEAFVQGCREREFYAQLKAGAGAGTGAGQQGGTLCARRQGMGVLRSTQSWCAGGNGAGQQGGSLCARRQGTGVLRSTQSWCGGGRGGLRDRPRGKERGWKGARDQRGQGEEQ